MEGRTTILCHILDHSRIFDILDYARVFIVWTILEFLHSGPLQNFYILDHSSFFPKVAQEINNTKSFSEVFDS